MIRGIGLRGAIAVNVISMIGIGPLITIPLVLADLHGAIALWAWVVGAAIALCDGLAFAELGSLYPRSGGTYGFLREAYGAQRFGSLFGFLFAWQTVLSIPLVLASGYIGFAHYAGYLYPPLGADARLQGIVAAVVGIVTLVALYRPITTVGRIGIVLAGVAVATLASIIAATATHMPLSHALSSDPRASGFTAILAGLGPALVITLYDYYGYGNSCSIGDEVRDPKRVLPRSVVFAILGIAVLYVALQFGVLGIVPWQELVPSAPGGATPDIANYVASTVVERTLGVWPARAVTVAILITAFASTFGGLLAASRIPFAAAQDGVFLRPFARLDARGRFPNISLLVIGLLAIPACFLSLGDVINALTAGMVVIAGIVQLFALVALRVRRVVAPYRMTLFPLPLVIALAGWTYIFFSSGRNAIIFGLASLTLGCIVFGVRAFRLSAWPFAARNTATLIACVTAIGLCGAVARAAGNPAAPTWGHARIEQRDGQSVFVVDGKPFFLYGAAFFYERLPRDQWAPAMSRLAAMGINTLDLYVPWNWHELSDGDFDFNGRTSPRRDFDEVLRLAKRFDFKLVLRPGPVVRNEWRNGGYPAWLLARPEYGMPLHDLLEGRYPPTATLQNQHSDDAAAEWMRNATHRSYAKRWLERALRESAPYADRVLAIALDDDQGAYIDNQTYPAPHFRAYLSWLRDVVHGVTGTRELTFVNTYQMKVPASSPVWAMGNWYQSDAYKIGTHDESQLVFSMAQLKTRPNQPLFASEFQAGWLQGAGEAYPRPADPSNTTLAIATMFGTGVRGLVNFPAQDTLDPTGWEAPFANFAYAWDAALELDGTHAARYAPTAAFGALVRARGSLLARSFPRYDAHIVYAGASVDPRRAGGALFSTIAGATIDTQQACRTAHVACDLIDVAAGSDRSISRGALLLVPAYDPATLRAIGPTLPERLAALARSRGARIVTATSPDAVARAMAKSEPIVANVDDAVFSEAPNGSDLAGFLSVTNYSQRSRVFAHGIIETSRGWRVAVPPFVVPAHDAVIEPIADGWLARRSATDRPAQREPANVTDAVVDAPPVSADAAALAWNLALRSHLVVPENPQADGTLGTPPMSTATSQDPPHIRDIDAFREGANSTVFDGHRMRLIVSPNAGARAFFLRFGSPEQNWFTTVGGLRDDVAIEAPLSTSDRIAKYTHDFPAGTFNRPYVETAPDERSRRYVYTAPDLGPGGITFDRIVRLPSDAYGFDVDERVDIADSASAAQRGVSVSSFAVGRDGAGADALFLPSRKPFAIGTIAHVTKGDAFAFERGPGSCIVVAWHAGDVEAVELRERADSVVARLTLARGRWTHVIYRFRSCRVDGDDDATPSQADQEAQYGAQVAPSAARTP